VVIAAHRATAHFKDYQSKINSLAERTGLVVNPVDVA
jgi:quinol monooxygenase YgiN